jgi:hypothetical protein
MAGLALPLALATAAPAHAAPAEIDAFDADTWAALQRQAASDGKPLLVVFSATWCAVCPEVITRLADDPRRARAQVPLLVVLADVSPGDADARLLASAHYRRADRLLAFDGPAAAIRHAVDPRWRGAAPYVSWLAPGQAPQFATGAPPADVLARWFAGAVR